MTLIGYKLPVWQCSATSCQYDTAWLQVANMTMLGQKLPIWQYSATGCQYATAESYWRDIRDFATSAIFSWSLTYHIPLISHPTIAIFSSIWTLFIPPYSVFKELETVFKDFLTSEHLEFCCIGINKTFLFRIVHSKRIFLFIIYYQTLYQIYHQKYEWEKVSA